MGLLKYTIEILETIPSYAKLHNIHSTSAHKTAVAEVLWAEMFHPLDKDVTSVCPSSILNPSKNLPCHILDMSFRGRIR